MNNFTQRTLSAFVYAGTMVAAILVHPLVFGIVGIGLTALAVREFHHLMRSTIFETIIAILAGGALFAYFWVNTFDKTSPYCSGLTLAIVQAVIIGIGLIAELFLKTENPIQNWGNILIGQIMIALPFSLMNGILGQNKYLLLALFVIIWVNDSGAYITGSLMSKRKSGNHKMFPRVSPAKSWEGLIGGIAFALISGYIFSIYVPALNQLQWLIAALCISIAGTLGDLMESLFKRTLGIKDSGCFLPGHGGVLDRFDSLLLATPVIWLLTAIF